MSETLTEYVQRTTKGKIKACDWTIDDPEMDTWATSCGELFIITCGTPSEHRMAYCCYCGKPLKEATP